MSARDHLVGELMVGQTLAGLGVSPAARPGPQWAHISQVQDGQVWLRLDAQSPELLASAIVDVGLQDIGRQVLVSFEQGDSTSPIIMGFMKTPMTSGAQAQVDGEDLVLKAQRQIVLQCGDASITLTRSGKVLIKGKYLLSQSSGVNSIKGGSVELN